MCLCLCMSSYVLAHGSLMLFISWLSCVTMLTQAAKAKSGLCRDDTPPQGPGPRCLQQSIATHRAQSIKQQRCSYLSCTTGNTGKQDTTQLLYSGGNRVYVDVGSGYTLPEANAHQMHTDTWILVITLVQTLYSCVPKQGPSSFEDAVYEAIGGHPPSSAA